MASDPWLAFPTLRKSEDLNPSLRDETLVQIGRADVLAKLCALYHIQTDLPPAPPPPPPPPIPSLWRRLFPR